MERQLDGRLQLALCTVFHAPDNTRCQAAKSQTVGGFPLSNMRSRLRTYVRVPSRQMTAQTSPLFDHFDISGRELVTATLPAVPSADAGRQRSLDDLGTPLHEVTFCVLDLETTGGNRSTDMITEIGAVKTRGGESLGTFQTMVNPGISIPAAITVLTGISQSMVLRAPRIGDVLPTFLEFLGDAVIVGHNVSFDLAFLNAALEMTGRNRLSHHVVDTLRLARRLIRDEVPNLKLATLARYVGASTQPTHRALDDALATNEVLHRLLERAGTMGVLGLDDLMALPKIDSHPQAHKLALTNGLPRVPGVYLFRDRDDRVLYVGKATNLRTRVRSYFSGDARRKVTQLLRETESISHIECPGPLEPEVTEVRLIHKHQPRFNRRSKTPNKYVYVKLTLNERFPRLSVVSSVKPDGALYLGPVPSRRSAKAAIDGIESVTPIRRCTKRSTKNADCGPCAGAQIGVTACPCSGFTSQADYDRLVSSVAYELKSGGHQLLGRIEAKMNAFAIAERFEEAADVRDRGAALASVLRRQRTFDLLRGSGRVVVELPGRGGVELDEGRLLRSWSTDGDAPLFAMSERVHQPGNVVDQSEADELMCVASWLEANAARLRLHVVEGSLCSAYPPLGKFMAGPGAKRRRQR